MMLDLHAVNVGLMLDSTHISHWWHREGHPAKTCSSASEKSHFVWALPGRCNKEVNQC